MSCSVIIPFSSDRLNNLQQTLRFLSLESCFLNSQIILICNDYIPKLEHNFRYLNLINLNSDIYCRARMCNIGVSESIFEKLVILDSDRVLINSYFEKYIKNLKENECITAKKIRQTYKDLTDEEIKNGDYEYYIDHRSESNEMHKKGMFSGNTIMHKSTYINSGMMDETYLGYGYQDIDFESKVLKNSGVMNFVDEIEIHLFHDRKQTKDNFTKSNVLNGIKFCKKWKRVPEELLIEAGKKVNINVQQLCGYPILL